MATVLNQLAKTAHHEAGHAVASFYLGIKFKYVTIVNTKHALGHIRNNKVQWAPDGMFDDGIRGADRAERHIVKLYAGQLADRKLHPRGRWRVGGSQDSAMASELFWNITYEDEKCRQLHADLLWRRAEVFVDLRWKDIQAVAQALLERKRLSHAEVVQAIHRANEQNHRPVQAAQA